MEEAGARSCWWMESTLSWKKSKNLEQRSGASPDESGTLRGRRRRFMVENNNLGLFCCEPMRVE